MTKPSSETKIQAERKASLKADRHPENLKEQGASGNLKQNLTPQHRTQDR